MIRFRPCFRRRLRPAILALVMGMLWPALSAQAGEAGSAAAIRDVIGRQMQAFLRDDGVEAFSHAAPNIRRMFGTSERFMDMVRGGYEPVYRPRDVEFAQLFERDGHVVQQVRLTGPRGRAWLATYEMQRQPDGSWKIRAVHLEPLVDLSV